MQPDLLLDARKSNLQFEGGLKGYSKPARHGEVRELRNEWHEKANGMRRRSCTEVQVDRPAAIDAANPCQVPARYGQFWLRMPEGGSRAQYAYGET